MKPHIPSLLLGIGITAGAFLLMGQSRQANPTHFGRYQVAAAASVNGCYVVDTATGAVKFLTPMRPASEPSPWGVPFDQAGTR